ncbi:hypothetical protein MPTK1_5g03750 [Marchantia polymorpha subsp. ruderalis]|uniref:Uncharacterized protein n=2 Tax=Marchantia polymorpha TaxID=3197 RepID=A0AAF6BEM8_MARPO|nr:hypothetical protein MARPO_0133s0014 [Marchantia polymorpha]BBN10462.1 hypothetical protein Mp_5g03750 [Marchantia polymorpha subsp. ruderalis]|eukprot:PTQ29864.1 hypothetical protein MARPO_0133s0014 [Marchantia polymorpha]
MLKGTMEELSVQRSCRVRPSLLELCLKQATTQLPDLAGSLQSIPLELAEVFFRYYLARGRNVRLFELEAFCRAFWNPRHLSLTGVEGLSCRGLTYLSHAPNLVRLDLSCCPWLDTLNFLPEIPHLRSLKLRDCTQLTEDSLIFIQQLRELECLDVENVNSFTERLASHIIQGMTSLVSLNCNGTGVGDGFVDALTYGCRLESWITAQAASKASGAGRHHFRISTRAPSNFDTTAYDSLRQQWPRLNIKYLHMQRTTVTQAATSNLLALEDIKLLDLRTMNVSRRTLVPLQAKYGLITPPNDFKLLGRSNSMLVATLGGDCCCELDTEAGAQRSEIRGANDWFVGWEHTGFTFLLREASRVQNMVYDYGVARGA